MNFFFNDEQYISFWKKKNQKTKYFSLNKYFVKIKISSFKWFFQNNKKNDVSATWFNSADTLT